MEEKNLEELTKKIAEQYGVSLAEAASFVSVAMKVTKAVAEIWKIVHEVVSRVLEKLKNLKYEENFDIRQTWSIVWDTRKKSQVILNKPKFAVRKIIK